MFGLGIWEIVVILAVALIVLGPRRLPNMARQLGRALREFRRATNELRYSIDEATAEDLRPPAPSPYTEPTEVVSSKPEVPAVVSSKPEVPAVVSSKPEVPANENPVIDELAEQASAPEDEELAHEAVEPTVGPARRNNDE